MWPCCKHCQFCDTIHPFNCPDCLAEKGYVVRDLGDFDVLVAVQDQDDNQDVNPDTSPEVP